MPPISFDRAVAYYDETRGFPAGVPEQIRDAILTYIQASPTTKFLELGIGTGRVALPFIEAGYTYDGMDVSAAMMERLEQKLVETAAANGKQRGDYHCTLYEGDITKRLPFEDGAYDAVIMVHVLHLVEDWQAVLTEARRILRPNGAWLLTTEPNQLRGRIMGSSLPTERPSPIRRVRAQWNVILDNLGANRESLQPSRNLPTATLETFLQSLGATTHTVDLVQYEQSPLSPRGMADRLKSRMYSQEWTLPDTIHAEAVQQLDQWLMNAYSDPDAPFAEQGTFRIVAATW